MRETHDRLRSVTGQIPARLATGYWIGIVYGSAEMQEVNSCTPVEAAE
jgi:hypothetical protein